MKKDVIYIDIEDDITSIIEKVKGAKSDIVALVPPKRIGTLQSVVNLKLLQRAAKAADKRAVLITSDTALSTLAAGVGMPVAKNLQSKPEIPEVAVLDVDDEDIINGDELPVGELAKTAPAVAGVAAVAVATKASADSSKSTPSASSPAATAPLAASAAANAPKKGSRVPNFEMFRKRLFLIIGAGVAFLIFLIWAIFFASHATVAITAKTNIVNINRSLQLKPDATLDVDQSVLPPVTEQTKKTTSVDFTATGKKEVGKQATGTVKLSKQSLSSTEVPAGTELTTSDGLVFVTNSDATVPPSSTGPGCFPTACPGSTTVTVTADKPGTKYNGASGDLNGAPNGVSASFTGSTSGGTDETVTVVSQSDVDKAKEDLKSKAQDANSIESTLKQEFGADVIIIDESFNVDKGTPKSDPAIGSEAKDGATLTEEDTFTIVGVKRTDLKAIYDAYLKAQIANDPSQKVYESGDNATQFSQFSSGDKGTYTVQASAVAQVGPNIDATALAKQLAGKRSGEIQQEVEAIQGVEDVQTQLSPFWVTKAPSNPSRITIKFVLKHDN